VTAFLLDTNVVSELVKPAPSARVLSFLSREADLSISVITLHELAYGAARMADPGRRLRLTNWLASIKVQFLGRIIAVDGAIAEIAGEMRGFSAGRGVIVTALDSLLAATTATRSMVLATRNVKDFACLPIGVIDPWSD
jgi:predicted nucleic acid-binding protein